jgi:toxin FitB
MYLIDTNVISEARKGRVANGGVRDFFADLKRGGYSAFLSVITIGELRRGIERIRHRGDQPQAARLEQWLERVVIDYSDNILPIDIDVAQIWGRLRVPHPENLLDKQIAATALLHDLTVVTRNVQDFTRSGVRLINPFDQERVPFAASRPC